MTAVQDVADPSPYAGTTPVPALAGVGGTVTLVEGQTFCLSGRSGDVAVDFPHGLFVFDTRVLSQWHLVLNGHRLEPLTVDVTDPFAATFLGHGAPAQGRADADVVVFRRRHIGAGMRERIAVTNHGLEAVDVDLQVRCDVDFADLFEVKESRVIRRGAHGQEVEGGTLRYSQRLEDLERTVTITADPPAEAAPGVLSWRLSLPPKGTVEVCTSVTVAVDGRAVEPRFTCGGVDAEALPRQRMATWRATFPVVRTDDEDLEEALQRSAVDLGALRIFDPEHPDLPILAAGAPWFMTVFGRDSLLTAWMTLLADPSLAHGVLRTLARFQGSRTSADCEEEPGKVLHEMRFGRAAGGLALGGGQVYYGSIDATPLFVMLAAEVWRWDGRTDLLVELLPHIDRAMAWIADHGDPDGDGYVEYRQQHERGLANQGWKDSWDAVRGLDGVLAGEPIALIEVQAYVYAAHLARAEIARALGDPATAGRHEALAADLRRRFDADFWMPEVGAYALGLDGDKRPIAAIASNVGHALWTGIVDEARAPAVAATLLSPTMFSGYGVRTLAADMPAYNPISYHNGSVWPHDNALCAAGLARYGLHEEAGRIITAQLDVAAHHHGRLPELFAGFGRDELASPAGYPTSCSPQAWAAASPLLWLRALLSLDPSAPDGTVWLAPALPAALGPLDIAGIRVGTHRLRVQVEGDDVAVDGLGDLTLVRGRRPLPAGPPPG